MWIEDQLYTAIPQVFYQSPDSAFRSKLKLSPRIPVLVIPYNPAARLAMIRSTVKTLWPKATGKARERREAQVMFILGTALTPS